MVALCGHDCLREDPPAATRGGGDRQRSHVSLEGGVTMMLRDKVAVVTGAARGIGREIAL